MNALETFAIVPDFNKDDLCPSINLGSTISDNHFASFTSSRFHCAVIYESPIFGSWISLARRPVSGIVELAEEGAEGIGVEEEVAFIEILAVVNSFFTEYVSFED